MSEILVPLAVALPLAVAALLAAVGDHLPRLLPDVVAICCAAAVTAITLILLLRTDDGPIVYWFGGWHPAHGFPLGIDFDIDLLSAAEAVLASVVVLGTLVYSWDRFERVRHFFHALMLALLAGMIGFVLSGDLFNLFVFLELMSVAAYALSGYRVERPEVIHGSMNFAILNSIGTFSLLMGVAILYGRTGTLNLVDMGEKLAADHPRGLLVAAFTLVTVGLLVKAGAAPFHFWLSDAYAVATAPAAAIFTAVMSDLAFNVYSKVHATVFAGSTPDDPVRAALLTVAVLSALVGAVMCFLQADLKRQLAFLTVSNGGVVLAGVAVLNVPGTAGSTMFVVSAGLLRGAAMLGTGMLVVHLGRPDELVLRGRGRGRRHAGVGVLLAVAALGLAAPPPFGPFLSMSLVYDGLRAEGFSWAAVLLAACVAVSAGTLLRATARIFLGWGPADDPALTRRRDQRGGTNDAEGQEDIGDEGDDASAQGSGDGSERGGGPRIVWPLVPAVPLVVAGLCLAFVPDLAAHALRAAQRLHDSAAHAAQVLHGVRPPPRPLPRYEISPAAWVYGGASLSGALLVAAAGLWWQRLPARGRRVVQAGLRRPVGALKAMHDGSVADYITWLVTGCAALAVAWAATLH